MTTRPKHRPAHRHAAPTGECAMNAAIHRSGSTRLGLTLAAVAFAATACVQPTDTIDRVQPNYIKKTDIVGKEYYLHKTSVETSFTAVSSFPGSMGSTVRGTFDIQEGHLYFLKTYEFMQGSEVFGQQSDKDTPLVDEDGNVVTRAVLQDYQRIRCTPQTQSSDCGPKAKCAEAGDAAMWPDEERYAGFCVREGTRYVYRGAPVAVYPIASHFDIQRDYSPASGERGKVVSENTSDREWYEREYMRVTWGAGHDFWENSPVAGTNGLIVYEGELAPTDEQFEQGTWHPTTADGPDEAHPQHYFTFVTKLVATAPTTFLAGFGDVPVCLFFPWAVGGVFSCASEEIKSREFFLEVPDYSDDPDRNYVARDTDDIEFEKFGYFRNERAVYDPQRSLTFTQAIRRVSRHRIWDRYVRKYVDEDGRKVWKGDFDYSQMNPLPIVYYLNDEHPRELVKDARAIADGWAEPFNEVVAHHKGSAPDFPMFILCENSDASAEAAKAAGYSYEDGTVAEHSGTPYGEWCRMMGEPKRFGDMRFSTMHAVTEPIQIGLYGYGPTASDPLTGEVIAGFAHSYVAAMKRGAERAMQVIEYAAGVKDANDIKFNTEQVFKAQAKAARRIGNAAPKSVSDARSFVTGMLDADVSARLRTVGLTLTEQAGTFAQSRLSTIRQAPELEEMLLAGEAAKTVGLRFNDPRINDAEFQWHDDQREQYSLATWNHVAAMRSRDRELMQLAERTMYLEQFADPAVLGLAQEYGSLFDKKICDAYAAMEPADRAFPWADLVSEYAARSRLGELPTGFDCSEEGAFEQLGVGAARRCVKVSVAVDDGTSISFSEQLRWAACASRDVMQTMRRKINDVTSGHPLAEDFLGLPSPLYADTLDPQVRKTQEVLREVVQAIREPAKVELWGRIYKGTQEHEVGHTLGLRHNFEASTDALNYNPKFWELKLADGQQFADPFASETPEQLAGHMRTWQLASVMDYTSKFNGRFAGLGLYDKAAIKFGYGDLIEVFENPPDLDAKPGASVPGMPAGYELPALSAYLQSPGDENPAEIELVNFGSGDLNRITRKVHYSTLPLYFGGTENFYKRKNVSWWDLRGDKCTADADCGDGSICRELGPEMRCARADLAKAEVPYRFCSDEYNTRTPTCATWDEGADPWEITRNALQDYENYWFFYGYARDGETYHPNNYAGTVERYLGVATRQAKYWMIQMADFNKGDWWEEHFGVPYDLDINGGLSGANATQRTFNTLAHVLSRPAPGFYGFNEDRGRFEPYTNADNSEYDVNSFVRFTEVDGARPLYAGYDFSGYLSRPNNGGQFYDRLAAFALLSDPTPPWYIGHNPNEDVRRYLVSFYNIFPRQLIDLFSGIAVEDSSLFGWYLLNGGPNAPEYLKARDWVGPDADNPPAPCDPNVGEEDQQVGCMRQIVFPDPRPTFPSSRFRMPLLGYVYGVSMLVDGFDRTFTDLSRIFLKGHTGGIDLPSALTVAEFADPLSGKVYVAPLVAGDTLNPGYLAVERANEELKRYIDDQGELNLELLQQDYLFSEYQYRVSLIEILRTTHELFEY